MNNIFTWASLFLRRRSRRGRCARSRLGPAQPAGVRAARCRRREHPHGHCLLWDDLMVGMDQGHQRGRARARPRPRTGARGLPLHSQRDLARLSPAPLTNARSLHSHSLLGQRPEKTLSSTCVIMTHSTVRRPGAFGLLSVLLPSDSARRPSSCDSSSSCMRMRMQSVHSLKTGTAKIHV